MIKKETVNMIAFILIGIIIVFCSCSGKDKETEKQRMGDDKIVATRIVPVSGEKVLSVLLRRIIVRNDSVSKDGKAVIDTLWGYEIPVLLRDSLSRPILDSLGKQRYDIGYAEVKKDSVNWRVENRPLDSLLKKK